MLKNKIMVVAFLVFGVFGQATIASDNLRKADFIERLVDNEESTTTEEHAKKYGKYTNYKALATQFGNRLEEFAGDELENFYKIAEQEHANKFYNNEKDFYQDAYKCYFKAGRLYAAYLRSISTSDSSDSQK